jgi:serine/threonine protein kinase
MPSYPEIEDVIGKYKLTAILGKGATSCVYKAYQENIKMEVALKVLSPDLYLKVPIIENIFFDEAKLLSKMSHPNVIRLIDANKINDFSYISMEYFHGKTLDNLIKDGPLEALRAIKIIIKVCSALEHILEFGFIHRDVKPGNIIINENNEIKLIDFGLSKVIGEPVKYQLIGGPMCGTPYYMSPEQLTDSDRIDQRADFYSVGATLYHMVTGKMPFETDNMSELISMHINEIPKKPVDIDPQITNRLSNLIMNLLDKSPGKRFQNYPALIKELKNIEIKYEEKNILSRVQENNIIGEDNDLFGGAILQQKFLKNFLKSTSEDK